MNCSVLVWDPAHWAGKVNGASTDWVMFRKVSWGSWSTQAHGGRAQRWITQPASDPLHGFAEWPLVLFWNHWGYPLVDYHCCGSHAHSSREDKWWEGAMFYLPHSLVVGFTPLVAFFVPFGADPMSCSLLYMLEGCSVFLRIRGPHWGRVLEMWSN